MQAIILNGGSSSGKTSIVRCFQDLRPEPWLAFSVDGFVDALPPRMLTADPAPDSDSDSDAGTETSSNTGIQFGPDGEVSVGADFRELEAAWTAGVVATARAGARIIVDDVFLGGAASQQRWEQALAGLDVLRVGVHCDSAVAASRESRRGDRTPGMAARQAEIVHQGVRYDLEIDSTDTSAADCARLIAARIT
ncbi:chloramphenicol phosphotransferase CPT [Catenulispora sp. NL8]|uniref:Chloramphenicol phosphotransferase CPT n=1 Tax=Catenulispora pinistramenti TaxID=2705254 RepID=A0ABS5KYB1_9ACTN|nr:chloramphenicol phosphotransferase CPT [Catenulispora pinistramenti]